MGETKRIECFLDLGGYMARLSHKILPGSPPSSPISTPDCYTLRSDLSLMGYLTFCVGRIAAPISS